MRMTRFHCGFLGTTLLLLGLHPLSRAEGLKSATVKETKNEVVFKKAAGEGRMAAVGDTVTGSDVLRTGKKSRAELEFADKSIARLGASTVFSFDASGRDMKLEQGTALIHVPPGLSGAKISTPAATAAIFGDVVAMRVDEKGATQVVALSRDSQGPVTVTFNKTGESRTLEPGQMLSIDPGAMKMPPVMDISVEVFAKTCPLIKSENSEFKAPLPPTAMNEMRQAQGIQQQEFRSGALQNSGNFISPPNPGSGPPMGLPRVDNNVLVQVAATSGLAGIYKGTGSDINGPSTFTMFVSPDGRMHANVIDPFGKPVAFDGIITNNGQFQGGASSQQGAGGPIQGNFNFQNNNISGSMVLPNGVVTVLTGAK